MAVCEASAISRIVSFTVTRGTEHKLQTYVGVGRERYCVWAKNLRTGEQERFHLRRSLNGHPKNLDFHQGRTCMFTKPGVYVVYASAPAVDLKVFIEVWGNAWDKREAP